MKMPISVVLLASAVVVWCGCSTPQTCCTCTAYCDSSVVATPPASYERVPATVEEPAYDPAPVVEPAPAPVVPAPAPAESPAGPAESPAAPAPGTAASPSDIEDAAPEPPPVEPSASPGAALPRQPAEHPLRRATRNRLVPRQFPRISYDVDG